MKGEEQKGQILRNGHFNQDPRRKRGASYVCGWGKEFQARGTARTNVRSGRKHGASV